MTRAGKLFVAGAAIAVFCGIAVGAFCVYVAFQHNPNFYYMDLNTGEVQWRNVLELFFASVVTIAVPLALLELLAWGAVRLVCHLTSSQIGHRPH